MVKFAWFSQMLPLIESLIKLNNTKMVTSSKRLPQWIVCVWFSSIPWMFPFWLTIVAAHLLHHSHPQSTFEHTHFPNYNIFDYDYGENASNRPGKAVCVTCLGGDSWWVSRAQARCSAVARYWKTLSKSITDNLICPKIELNNHFNR